MKNDYAKKKLICLFFVWFTFLMSIGIAWVIHTFIGSGLVFSIVVFVLIVILFLTLFYCKSKISYYDMKQRYQLLLQSSKGLEPTTCKFDNNWLLRLKQNHYAMFLDNPNFTIYYKIEKSISKKTFIKTHVIQILTIIKNSDLDLFSNQIELEYKSLWMKFEKEYRLNKQVIIQFVKYKSFDDTIKNNLDRIISYKEGDNYMIHINCGYFIDSQSIYYLHSDTYYPNIYYKYAIDNIKDNTN